MPIIRLRIKRLLHKLADLLEFSGRRSLAPFEDRGFRSRRRHTVEIQPRDRSFPINAVSRADRIDGEMDVESAGHQVKRRLSHTDMSLDSAQQNRLDAVGLQERHDFRTFTATEHRFLFDDRGFRDVEIRDGVPEPFRILL